MSNGRAESLMGQGYVQDGIGRAINSMSKGWVTLAVVTGGSGNPPSGRSPSDDRDYWKRIVEMREGKKSTDDDDILAIIICYSLYP